MRTFGWNPSELDLSVHIDEKKRNIIFIALQGRSKNQSFFSQGYLFYGVFSQCWGHPTGSVSLKELMAEIDQDGNGVISVDEDSWLMSL